MLLSNNSKVCGNNNKMMINKGIGVQVAYCELGKTAQQFLIQHKIPINETSLMLFEKKKSIYQMTKNTSSEFWAEIAMRDAILNDMVELQEKVDAEHYKTLETKPEKKVQKRQKKVLETEVFEVQPLSGSPESARANKESQERRKKKAKIPIALKRKVWSDNFGNSGESMCWCCKNSKISPLAFHCGHVVAESNGGETCASNLKPVCSQCNASMGTKNMEDFKKMLHS